MVFPWFSYGFPDISHSSPSPLAHPLRLFLPSTLRPGVQGLLALQWRSRGAGLFHAEAWRPRLGRCWEVDPLVFVREIPIEMDHLGDTPLF